MNPVVSADLESAVNANAAVGDSSPSGSTRQGHARMIGKGPARRFLEIGEVSDPAYPPRPVPGGIMDLDLVLEKCDFGTNKVCCRRSSGARSSWQPETDDPSMFAIV